MNTSSQQQQQAASSAAAAQHNSNAPFASSRNSMARNDNNLVTGALPTGSEGYHPQLRQQQSSDSLRGRFREEPMSGPSAVNAASGLSQASGLQSQYDRMRSSSTPAHHDVAGNYVSGTSSTKDDITLARNNTLQGKHLNVPQGAASASARGQRVIDPQQQQSAFHCPLPLEHNPIDLLVSRFQGYRKIIKDLIAYYREVQGYHDQRYKSVGRMSAALNSAVMPPGFLPDGGLDDAFKILHVHHKQAMADSQRAREIEENVVLSLASLRADLGDKIKEIKGLSGDFKNNVDKEMDGTHRAITALQDSLNQTNASAISQSSTQDPYLLKLAVDRQLERQIDEENYLHQAYLNVEMSGRELESVVVEEIQKSYNALATLLRHEGESASKAAVELHNGPITIAKDKEWDDFVSRHNHFMDPSLPVRSFKNIVYPGRDHSACREIRSGVLERQSKYLKNYSAGWYVLTPTHLHEFKSQDTTVAPVMSLNLMEQQLGTHSPPGARSAKFSLKGRQLGSMHRGHNWVFRAESHDVMKAWYEDLKKVTEPTSHERFESTEGTEYDDGDEEEAFGSSGALLAGAGAAAVGAGALKHHQSEKQHLQAVPSRPKPGRFPSDLVISPDRGRSKINAPSPTEPTFELAQQQQQQSRVAPGANSKLVAESAPSPSYQAAHNMAGQDSVLSNQTSQHPQSSHHGRNTAALGTAAGVGAAALGIGTGHHYSSSATQNPIHHDDGLDHGRIQHDSHRRSEAAPRTTAAAIKGVPGCSDCDRARARNWIGIIGCPECERDLVAQQTGVHHPSSATQWASQGTTGQYSSTPDYETAQQRAGLNPSLSTQPSHSQHTSHIGRDTVAAGAVAAGAGVGAAALHGGMGSHTTTSTHETVQHTTGQNPSSAEYGAHHGIGQHSSAYTPDTTHQRITDPSLTTSRTYHGTPGQHTYLSEHENAQLRAGLDPSLSTQPVHTQHIGHHGRDAAAVGAAAALMTHNTPATQHRLSHDPSLSTYSSQTQNRTHHDNTGVVGCSDCERARARNWIGVIGCSECDRDLAQQRTGHHSSLPIRGAEHGAGQHSHLTQPGQTQNTRHHVGDAAALGAAAAGAAVVGRGMGGHHYPTSAEETTHHRAAHDPSLSSYSNEVPQSSHLHDKHVTAPRAGVVGCSDCDRARARSWIGVIGCHECDSYLSKLRAAGKYPPTPMHNTAQHDVHNSHAHSSSHHGRDAAALGAATAGMGMGVVALGRGAHDNSATRNDHNQQRSHHDNIGVAGCSDCIRARARNWIGVAGCSDCDRDLAKQRTGQYYSTPSTLDTSHHRSGVDDSMPTSYGNAYGGSHHGTGTAAVLGTGAAGMGAAALGVNTRKSFGLANCSDCERARARNYIGVIGCSECDRDIAMQKVGQQPSYTTHQGAHQRASHEQTAQYGSQVGAATLGGTAVGAGMGQAGCSLCERACARNYVGVVDCPECDYDIAMRRAGLDPSLSTQARSGQQSQGHSQAIGHHEDTSYWGSQPMPHVVAPAAALTGGMHNATTSKAGTNDMHMSGALPASRSSH